MPRGSAPLPPVASPIGPAAYVDMLARTGMGLVCILDTAGRILHFDEACERATGFTVNEVLGRDARETVIPPEEAEAFGQFIEQVSDTPSPSPQIGHWLTASGERRLIAWSNRPILDDSGAVTGLVTVGLDLTERDRASAELRALHNELRNRLEEQAALRRVATLVAGEATPELVFDAVAAEIGRVAGADASAVVRYEGNGTASVVGRHGAEPAVFPVGSGVPIEPTSSIGRVLGTGAAARAHASEAPESSVIGSTMRRLGFTSSVAAPIGAAGRPWGAIVVVAAGGADLPDDMERRLGPFADLLALAIASADAREQLLESRARLVAAADDERRRLERDLHDGAQQRLVTLALKLGLARRNTDDTRLAELLDEAESEARGALKELRDLARGLHPPVLAERGLGPALATLARRAPLMVTIEHAPQERFASSLEVAAYFVVAEALTNIAKHADATEARITARREGNSLVVAIADNGRGGANPRGGTGIRGLIDRVDALRGTLDITSSPSAGTVLRAELPL
jgi:PAS domain S-box-containing protein